MAPLISVNKSLGAIFGFLVTLLLIPIATGLAIAQFFLGLLTVTYNFFKTDTADTECNGSLIGSPFSFGIWIIEQAQSLAAVPVILFNIIFGILSIVINLAATADSTQIVRLLTLLFMLIEISIKLPFIFLAIILEILKRLFCLFNTIWKGLPGIILAFALIGILFLF